MILNKPHNPACRLIVSAMTPRQRILAKKHGTPPDFASSVYKCVPGDISMDEARAAIDKYNREWAEAGQTANVSAR